MKRAVTSGGLYTTLATANTTSYTDTALTNGTRYYYVVSAANAKGESANSAEVSAMPVPPVPSTPAGLTATAGNQQVALSWTAISGATSYHVKRGTAAGGPYTQVAAPTANSYTDTGLTNGAHYYYVVTAVNAGGESGNSAEISATPAAPAPPVPTGLTATPGNQQVSLSWNSSAGAISYNVKRGTAAGGPYVQVASSATNSYTDAGLTIGTRYYYVVTAVNAGGESANSAEASATPVLPAPSIPAGLRATAGDQQVLLSWTAVAGATSYRVKRGTTAGGPYTQLGSPSASSYTDTGLANGTPYYYVVSAVNTGGESGNSAEVTATPTAATPAVTISVDVLRDRHAISPYIYGVNFPNSTAYVSDSGATLIRWGGNASTRYNWKNFNTNAANDWYFINRPMDSTDTTNPFFQDSLKFVSDVTAVGGSPVMTIGMLPWVAKDATSYSYSVAKYGAQCKTDPWNTDHGNGQKTDCATNVTGNDPHDAHVALLDAPGDGDPAGSVYRSEWVAALAPKFGAAPHFYNMDNEIDIWGGTHHDVHPNPTGYVEMRDIFLQEARGVKTWDPQAVTFGPVSCCWWFYWSAASGESKSLYGGLDFLPWWLNEIAWKDQVDGVRSLDVFDFHAYIDGPTTSGWTQAQLRALAGRLTRDYWDRNYISENSVVNQPWWTQTQYNRGIPFRIPRMRAWVNTIYPGTQLAITEWNTSPAGESDFSTALVDADAFGIFGRERMFAAARWTAADASTPAYQALKLYRNYDGQHHGFGTVSVAATHNADPNLLSTYAALDATGSTLTLLVLNKDPQNAVSTQINFAAFNATQVKTYTLASTQPTTIAAGLTKAWTANWTFAPYSATLLVISGAMPQNPSAEWDLNPESINVPAGGTVVLHPRIVSGSGTVTLNSAEAEAFINVTPTLNGVSTGQDGAITVVAGNLPGFYRFTVTGADDLGVTQTQGGWIVVGNPAATLTKTGDNQSAARGTVVTIGVTLSPEQSGGSARGASVLFTTDAGTLSNRIVPTNIAGVASVQLTLPDSAATVHVTAEGPFGLGHPVVTFTATSQ